MVVALFNLETDRLFFRNWNFSDLVILYALAKNPNVGPCAGWKPHKTIEESAEVLKKFVKRENLFAICLKSTGKIIGAIEIKNKERSKLIEGPSQQPTTKVVGLLPMTLVGFNSI